MAGGGDVGASCVHVAGAPPLSNAPFSTQVSDVRPDASIVSAVEVSPPKTIIALVVGSSTAVWCERPLGAVPLMASLLHACVPPLPFALERSQTSSYCVHSVVLHPTPPK